MARISQYDQDSTLNKLDKVLGTDSATGATKNYSIDSMMGLINSEDLVNVFDGVSYAFKDYRAGSTTPKGIINLNAGAAADAAFSAINQIYISILDKQGNSIANYLDDTVNSFIRIVQKTDINIYGVLEVTAVADHDSGAYKLLTVTPRVNNGNIIVDEEYFISNYSAVFDQDFSDDSVTEFGDVTSAGSGEIITNAERTSLNNFTANGLLHADVVNNVTSTATDVPLSAAQGKVLKDLIDTINTLLTSDNIDLDSLQEVVDFIEANKDTLDNLGINNIAGLQAALDAKQDAEVGKGLSTEDFTTALLAKLNGIAAQAEVNVNANWNETNSNSDAFIQNKPTDLTTLATHNVTELSDVTSAGSGSIISSAERTKLAGIEALADVTDTANVTAAGALMDSEVTNLADVKAFDTTDYATAAQGVKADSAQQPPAEGAFVDGDKTKLDSIESNADVTDTANVTAAGALMDSELTNEAAVKAINQGLATTDDVDFNSIQVDDTIELITSQSSTPTFDNGIYYSTEDGHDTLHFRYHGHDLSIDYLTENIPTGILNGGELSTNTNTTFDVAAGDGIINILNKDASDPHPEIKKVEWSATTITHTLGNASETDQLNTWVYVDSTGTIQQTLTIPSPNLWRNNIVLGSVIHSENVIRFVKTFPRAAYSNGNTVSEFIEIFGPLKKSGHLLTVNSSNNMALDRSAGVAFALGRNYEADAEEPNLVSDSASTPSFHRYSSTSGGFTKDDGVAGAGYTDIDPTKYDNNGTLTTVSGGHYSVQRLYYFPNNTGVIVAYYGKDEYNSMDLAEKNYLLEDFQEAENTSSQAIYLGAIILKGNVSNLNTASDAKILTGGIFRSLSATNLGGVAADAAINELSDVNITSVANNEVLKYNSSTGNWENQTDDIIGGSGSGVANKIAIWSGASALTQDSSLHWDAVNDRLGVGTSSPASKLSVSNGIIRVQNGSNVTYYEEDKINAYAAAGYTILGREGLTLETLTANTDIILSPTGNVGIGTTSPSELLHVLSSGNISRFESTTPTGNIVIENDTTTSKIGSVSSNFVIDLDPTNAVANSRIIFKSDGSEKMRIDSSGRVGINQSSPTAGLHVVNSNSIGESIAVLEALAAKNGYVYINADDNRRKSLVFQSGGVDKFSMGVGDSDELSESSFFIGAGKGGGNNADLVINSSGNVGIGSTSPSQKLVVAGNISTSGVVLFNDNKGINFGNSSAKIYGSSADGIKFNGGGSEKMRLTQAGNLGIGTTSPIGLLELYKGDSGQTSVVAGGDNLVLNDSANGGMTILTPSTAIGSIFFGDEADNDVGYLRYNHSSNEMWFGVSGSRPITINSSGNVGIGSSSPVSKLTLEGARNTNTITLRTTDNDSGWTIGDEFGAIEFYSNDTSGGSAGVMSAISCFTGTTSGSTSKLSFSTSEFGSRNVERMRIDSNGNVGIGTTSPSNTTHIYKNATIGVITSPTTANAGLRIQDSASNMYFDGNSIILDSTGYITTTGSNDFYIGTNNATRLFVAGAGNVGIGTTSPQEKLTVSSSGQAKAKLVSTDNSGARFDLHSVGGGRYSLQALAGSDFLIFDEINGHTAARYGDGSSGNWRFFTNNSEAMRIDSSGNVGIGTTSPAYKLDIDGNIRGEQYIYIKDTGGTKNLTLRRELNYGTIDNGTENLNYNASNHLFLSGFSEKMRIDSSGNVGIGTTSPDYRFHAYHATTNVVGQFESGDNQAWISVKDDGYSTYGAMLGCDHDAGLNIILASTSAEKRLVIDNSGNVGIGTTDPRSKFQVTGSVSVPAAGSQGGTASFGGGSYGLVIGADASGKGYIQSQRNDGTATTYDLMVQPNGGNVGIGTTSPSGKLHIQTDASSNFIFTGASTSGYSTTFHMDNVGLDIGHNSTSRALNLKTGSLDRLTIKGTGKVGIGTTSPTEKLEVAGNVILDSSNANLKLKSGTVGTKGDIQWTFNSDNTVYASVGIEYDNRSTDGFLIDSGYPITIDAAGAYTRFSRNGAEHMRIDSSGNVGIGTTSPTRELEVQGGGNVYIKVAASTDNDSSAIELQNTQETWTIRNDDTNDDAFEIDSSTTGNIITIEKTGNVGIGTTGPSEKLHVSGNARITGAIYDSNNSSGTSGQVLSSTATGTDWISLSEISGVDGSGTTNYVAKWSDTDTITDSVIFDNGTNVGIGTDSPNELLHLNVGDSGTNYLQFTNSTTGTGSTDGMLVGLGNGEEATIWQFENDHMRFGTNNSERMRIDSQGRVGIGTTSPENKLHLSGGNPSSADIALGDAYAQFGIYNVGNQYGIQQFVTGSGDGHIQVGRIDGSATAYDLILQELGGNVGIGTDSPSAPLTFGKSVYGDFNSENFYRIKIQDQGGTMNDVGIGQTASGNMGFNNTSGSAFIFNNGTSGEIARFNGTGLGIGTTSPNEKLHVKADTNGDGIKIQRNSSTEGTYGQLGFLSSTSDATAANLWIRGYRGNSFANNFITFGTDDTERLRIDPSGNVGIGTTSPSTLLHIESDSAPTLTIDHTGKATWADGDIIGKIDFFTSDTSGNGPYSTSFIQSENEQASGTITSGALVFGTATYNAAGGAVERMRINSSGNVGIGTASPTSVLHISNTTPEIYLEDSNNTADAKLLANNGNLGLFSDVNNEYASSIMYFNVDGSEKMRIDSSGNLGIGTTSPQGKLHIYNPSGTNGLWITRSNNTSGVGLHLQTDSSKTRINSYGDLTFWTAATGATSTEKVRITSGGNVGIGANIPLGKLHVSTGNNSNSGNIEFVIGGTDGNNARTGRIIKNTSSPYEMTIRASDYSSGNNLILNDTGGNVGIGTTSPAATLDVDGAINAAGGTFVSGVDTNANVGIAINKAKGLYSNDGNYIRRIIEHTSGSDIAIGQGATSLITNITFQPGTSGDIKFYPSGSQDVTFKSDGRVGIGTTSPNAKLDISFAGGGESIKSASTSSTSYNSSKFYNDNSKGWHNLIYGSAYSSGSLLNIGADGAIIYGNTTSGITTAGSFDLLFGTNSTERMRIDSSGNVGIGTSTPNQKFHIYGNSSFSNLFTVTTTAVGINTQNPGLNGGLEIANSGLRISNSYGNMDFGQLYSHTDLRVATSTSKFYVSNGSSGPGGPSDTQLAPILVGQIGVKETSPTVAIDAGNATDAIKVPVGDTSQRPTGADGMLRYNSDDAQFEGYADGAWVAIDSTASTALPPVTSGMILNLQGSEYTSGSTWTDQSSQSNDFTLYNSPTYNSTTKGFTFDGANDYARASSNILGTSPTAFTVIVRMELTSTSASQFYLSARDSSTSGWLVWYSGGSNKLTARWNTSTYNFENTTTFTTGTKYTIGISWDGSNAYWYTDGGAAGSTAMSQTLSLSSSSNTSLFTDPYQLNPTPGKVYEYIVYNSSLNSTQHSNIHTYLNNKY